ncbi:terminase small subunit [Gottfriedia sp. NPDC057948]|uniref:terminase small subunit n=1 Tax=Gottfriedia sp. NPDC057948 TaxID=3346287 RepID=UPI0036D931DC
MRLTLKQQAFVEEYIRTGNATQSAINSGYSRSTAYAIGAENLKKPQIKECIQKRMSSIQDERIATADEVLRYLTSVMRAEVTEEKLLFTKQGHDFLQLQVNVNDRNKAAELLGKRYALFNEKKEISGNVGVHIIDDLQ